MMCCTAFCDNPHTEYFMAEGNPTLTNQKEILVNFLTQRIKILMVDRILMELPVMIYSIT